MDFILFVWLTIHEPQPNGVVNSRKVTVRQAFPTMAACKEAQAGAEAAYAKAPVPNLLINCVHETDEDRARRKEKLARVEERRKQIIVEGFCRERPKPCP